MTIKELHRLTDCDVFLRSSYSEYCEHEKNDDGELVAVAPDPNAYISPLLLGIAGISGLEVEKIRFVPEYCAVWADVPLPPEIIKAICKYNRMCRSEHTKRRVSVCPFTDDAEKMRDFYELTKEEFLQSYSYLTEDEYDATAAAVRMEV